MPNSQSIRYLACGLMPAGSAAGAKTVAHAQHAKPAPQAAPAPQTDSDEEEQDGWSGPVPRTQRGSRIYSHGIGWNNAPYGYYPTPAAPVYHHGVVTPGYPEDGPN